MCWHAWSKWEIFEEGSIGRTHTDGKTVPIGNYIMQRRHCSKCGKAQIDRQKLYV
jgi:hypothetical protein